VVVEMAASLAAMTARFAREHWDGAAGARAEAEALRARAAPLAQEDAEAYEAILTAMRMPKDLEPEVRNTLIGDTLSRAADAPLRIAEVADPLGILHNAHQHQAGRERARPMHGRMNHDFPPHMADGLVDSLLGLEQVGADHLQVGASQQGVGRGVEHVAARVQHLAELAPHPVQTGGT
jgi:hypothetical protein